MIQWTVFILNIYIWFQHPVTSSIKYFEPCNFSSIGLYSIKAEKRLDFFQDCAIINGQVANKLLSLRAFKSEKEKQEYVAKVRKYYGSN